MTMLKFYKLVTLCNCTHSSDLDHYDGE